MHFLHPALTALAVFFTVPLLIHLLNRRRFQRLPWAAMDFLMRAYRRNRRRLRLENLLLLLLRCAVPVVLALALARPRFGAPPRRTAGAGGGRHHILILDRSYSMGIRPPAAPRPFDRMKQEAETLAARLARTRGNRLSLILMDGRATVPLRGSLEPAAWRKALAAALRRVGDGRADFLRALRTAAEVRGAFPDEPAVLHLWSDFQVRDLVEKAAGTTGERRESAGGLNRSVVDMLRDFAADAEVHLHPVAPRSLVENTAVVDLVPEPRDLVLGAPAALRVRLRHYGRQARELVVRTLVDGSEPVSRAVRVDPGRTLEIETPLRVSIPGDHLVTVALDGDSLATDDKRSAVIRARRKIRILFVEGGEPADDPILARTFLYRNLLQPDPEAKDPSLTVFEPVVISEDRFHADPSAIDRFDVVALVNVSGPRVRGAARLRRWVRAGGGLLVSLGPDSVPDLYNLRLFGRHGRAGPLPLRILEPRGTLPEPGAEPQSFHPRIVTPEDPVLADFPAGGLGRIFEATPVYRYFATSLLDRPEDTEILVELRDPASPKAGVLLARRRFGKGRCILLTSNVDSRPDRWNHLDDIWISLPLVHSIVRNLATRALDERNLPVGAPISLWLTKPPKDLAIVLPNGQRAALPLPKGGGTESGWIPPPFTGTWRAGAYRVRIEYEGPEHAVEERLYAVRPDPEEGEPAYVSPQVLAEHLPGLQVLDGLAVENRRAESKAGTGDFGRALLLAVLILALGEALLAGLLGRRRW